jgi:hypothetical protein
MFPGQLQERLDRLTPAGRALIQQRLARNSKSTVPQGEIPRRARTGPCVASFSQQQLWLLDQLTPDTSTYNVPYAMRLRGALDVEALAQALEMVIGRHQVLRTILASVMGNPVQVVMSSWPTVLRVVDLRGRSPDRQEVEVRQLLEDEARRPFHLDRDLMLRACVVLLEDHESIFLHVAHHVAWDYQSRALLYSELAHFYEALATRVSPSLPELPIQYADFAVWQRRRMRGELLAELTAYWKAQLAGVPTELRIPTDCPRPPVQRMRGAKYFFDLSPRLVEAAKSLSGTEGVTLYMTLLAVFQSFLFTLTGQDDFCVGSPIAGRNQVQTENLIGFFINTVVLRGRLSSELAFRELLNRVRETVLGAHAHHELPFESLVEIVRPPRNLGRNPLIQVNFRVASLAPPVLQLPGLSITPLELIDTATSKFDFAMELTTLPGVASYCEYDTDLFTLPTIEGLCGQFQRTLDALLDRPDIRLGELGPCRAIAHGASAGTRLIPVLGSPRRSPIEDSDARASRASHEGEQHC